MNYLSSKFSNRFSIEIQKALCTTLYEHLLALVQYDIMNIPKISSPIILLKPTIPSITFTEEDYGLHKVRFFEYVFIYACTFRESHFNTL